MKVIDCFWELNNLNKRTVEIIIEGNDKITEEKLKGAFDNFDYVVVKVPVNRIDVNTKLANLGFVMIESQYKISKLYKDFNPNDKLVKLLMPKFNFKEITKEEEFRILRNKMTLGMFSTDRIALDPHFGIKDSLKRYKNWMTTEFENKTSEFLLTCLNDEPISYSMYKRKGNTIEALLGGIFEKYQNSGYGLLTPIQHFLYAYKSEGKSFSKMKTSVSSNNTAVVGLYNYLGFKLINTTYVFVKHLK